MMSRSLIPWLIGLLVLASATVADAGSSQRIYQEKKIEERKLDRQTWKKAEDGLDYTDQRPKPKESKQEETPTAFKLTSVQQLVLIIVFAIVFVVLIIFLL